jgi:hypothetical protein
MRIMSGVTAAGVAVLFSSVAAQAADTFPTLQSTIKYSTTSGVTSGFGNYARAGSQFVYDAASDTFTVRDAATGVKSTFGLANEDTTASNAEFLIFNKNGGTETFRLLNRGASNPAIQLTYVLYGEWTRTATSNGTTSVNDQFLVGGSRTGSMPRTGSANYTTMYDGNFVDSNGAHALSGSGGITASFGSGSVNYTANINGVPSGSLAFSGTGSIDFKGAGFTTTSANGGYTLSQNGIFYGPTANEVGGLFRLTNGVGNGQGAFVGKQ